MKQFYSNGKLLLTGEYFVLDGALSLAVPTKFGQRLTISKTKDSNKIVWNSLDNNAKCWFYGVFHFHLNKVSISTATNQNTAKRLIQILEAAKQLNPDFLVANQGYKVQTELNFPKNWGLGSSSTLINNLASWANVDAYQLLSLTFGGSGYDIACAQNNSAITYQLKPAKQDKEIIAVSFNPNFKKHLYFLHLNQKQNSRDGIKLYKSKNTTNNAQSILKINQITQKIIACNSFTSFCELINQHEQLVANYLQLLPVKQKWFPDFFGSIKSLGAWGGDFVLVASLENPKTYFEKLGYNTLLSYNELIIG